MIRQRLPQKGTLDKAQPRDMFQTPNYAVDLLVPFIPKNINWIWECAYGQGKLADRLDYHGYSVYGTDILTGQNFLLDSFYFENGIEDVAIITNPPYSLKRKFFERCLWFNLPFALLISGDYSLWTIDAIRKHGCEKIIPSRRIDFITPTGLSGASGHTSYFHSYWLTYKFNLGKSETFVELTKKMKENI